MGLMFNSAAQAATGSGDGELREFIVTERQRVEGADSN